MTPEFDAITPHPDGVDPAEELIHERAYVVRAYREGPDTLMLRGAVRDQKPPGLYIADDPEPLTIHHMIVDLEIGVPSLEITAAKVVLEVHPHLGLPTHRGPLRQPRRPVDRSRLHPQGARAVRRPARLHPHDRPAASDGSGCRAIDVVLPDGAGREPTVRARRSTPKRRVGAR